MGIAPLIFAVIVFWLSFWTALSHFEVYRDKYKDGEGCRIETTYYSDFSRLTYKDCSY